jgi:hypothetical protein
VDNVDFAVTWQVKRAQSLLEIVARGTLPVTTQKIIWRAWTQTKYSWYLYRCKAREYGVLSRINVNFRFQTCHGSVSGRLEEHAIAEAMPWVLTGVRTPSEMAPDGTRQGSPGEDTAPWLRLVETAQHRL